ncbi:MAG: dihydrodipicolinate synthase family protein [Acidobacteriia bacterium]|nr:dihydrodipicolinate synthase family protein [Terriglobia bacterium]
MTEVQGVNAAAVTPRGKQGDVDFGATFELIDYLGAARVQGIALFTAAGEFPALAPDERSRLLYLAVKRSRVPVLAGVGSATLDLSVALAREARNAGASALLLPPPHFFRYRQDEIREFYLQFVAQVGSGTGILLSHTPLYASGLEVETATGLLATGQFAGIEDASGDLEFFSGLQAAAGALPVLVGSDAVFTRAREAGAAGVVSPIACAVPELLVALDRAICAGDREKTGRLDGMLQEFAEWMDQFPQPVAVKAATALRGVKTGPAPVPLPPARQKKLDEFREWFQAWLPLVKRLDAHA